MEQHHPSSPAADAPSEKGKAHWLLDLPTTLSVAAAAAGAYVFNAKTSDALYDNLKRLNKVPEVSSLRDSFKTTHHGTQTATELPKFHQRWSETYNQRLRELGFTSPWKRFGGLHHNQKLEVLVQSVTAVGLVVGFSALLQQLRSTQKTDETHTR